MRRLGIALFSTVLLAQPAFAGKTQLPEERRGTDPKPDAQAAEQAYKRGQYDRAIQQARLSLSRDERYAPAMMVLAKSYFAQKKIELATAIAKQVQDVDKNNAEAHNLLGFISLQKDDRIAATVEFKKATELDGNFSAAWNNLAAQYLFAKNYDSALDAAEKATKLAPNFSKAWLNLGSAYRGKQQYADADRAYKKALELDPNYYDAFFDLGILYLDAEQMPGMDTIQRLNQAITYLARYQQLAGIRLPKDDPAGQYIADAKKAIDKEQKRLDRERKKKEKAAASGGAKTGGDK